MDVHMRGYTFQMACSSLLPCACLLRPSLLTLHFRIIEVLLMFIQLGFAALITVLSWAIILGTLNIAGIFIAALLGTSPNEIDKFNQACNDRDNKKS